MLQLSSNLPFGFIALKMDNDRAVVNNDVKKSQTFILSDHNDFFLPKKLTEPPPSARDRPGRGGGPGRCRWPRRWQTWIWHMIWLKIIKEISNRKLPWERGPDVQPGSPVCDGEEEVEAHRVGDLMGKKQKKLNGNLFEFKLSFGRIWKCKKIDGNYNRTLRK